MFLRIVTKYGGNKAAVILKTGRFDNIDSTVIISSVSKMAYTRLMNDDDSSIYVVEMSSFKNEAYCGFAFPR